jgi:hypothetical protein
MATQTIEFRSPPTQTTTAKLFAVGSDTQVASVTATEATNRKGTYAAAYTDVAAGEYELIAFVGAVPVARWFVTLTLTTATFQVYDKAKIELIAANAVNASSLATDAVTEIQSGLATQTSVDDLPTNAELATALGTADDAVLAAIATVQSDTNDIQTRLPAALESGRIAAVLDSAATAALVDLIWDEPLTGATHNVATSSGKRLRQTTAFQQIDSTVIDAAATTTTFATGLDSAVDDFYNDSMLVFTDGALAGQVRAIYDYVGATKTIVLEEALTSAPVNGVAFAIVSLHIHPVSQIQSGLATASALATQAAKINKIEAVATGTVTGAGTSTEVFVGPSATLTITVDSSGNRSAVVVT